VTRTDHVVRNVAPAMVRGCGVHVRALQTSRMLHLRAQSSSSCGRGLGRGSSLPGRLDRLRSCHLHSNDVRLTPIHVCNYCCHTALALRRLEVADWLVCTCMAPHKKIEELRLQYQLLSKTDLKQVFLYCLTTLTMGFVTSYKTKWFVLQLKVEIGLQ
jgi:hypothetical protein